MEQRQQMKQMSCGICNEIFDYEESETFTDDHGFGYSTKLVECNCCGRINVIRYFHDRSMKLNNDSRYYDYRR